MHADRLYHQMLDYERRVEEAKAAGLQPPPAKSLFKPSAEPAPQPTDSKTNPAATETDMVIPGGEAPPPGMKPEKPLQDLTPHERELEIQLEKQKRAQRQVYYNEVSGVLEADNAAREQRRKKFSGWFGETIGNWLA